MLLSLLPLPFGSCTLLQQTVAVALVHIDNVSTTEGKKNFNSENTSLALLRYSTKCSIVKTGVDHYRDGTLTITTMMVHQRT